MRYRQKGNSPGFTMIELLVVMGIIAILVGITIPVLSSGGGLFGRSELSRTAQILQAKLQAAQIYANTYRVNTAVVYSLDNWVPPDPANPDFNPPVAEPIIDSVFTGFADSPLLRRSIVAAAVMYELPPASGAALQGKYVPIPGDHGAFEYFPGNHVVLLHDPYQPLVNYYEHPQSRYLPNSAEYPNSLRFNLGMSQVDAITGAPDVLHPQLIQDLNLAPSLAAYVAGNSAVFPAHKFSRVGKMQVSGVDKERIIIHTAASPAATPDNRLVTPNSPELVTIPIELYRSTGRVRMAR